MKKLNAQRIRWMRSSSSGVGGVLQIVSQNRTIYLVYYTPLRISLLIQRAFNSWSVGVVPFTLHAQHTFLSLASPHSMNDDERCWFKLLSLKICVWCPIE